MKGSRTPAFPVLDARSRRLTSPSELTPLAHVDLMPTWPLGRLHATMTWVRHVTEASVGTANLHLRCDAFVLSYDDTDLPRVFIEDQGMRIVSFSEEEVVRLTSPFQHTLYDQFMAKRPPMEVIEEIY